MDNLEGLVRRIVNTVNGTRTRPAEANALSTSGAPAQQSATTVEEEVRRRYSLPRNATSTEQSAESTQSSSFSLPVETRRAQRSNVGPLSQYFHPTENYGQCTLRAQSRNRQVRPQRRCASPYVQPCKDKVKSDSFTLKEVVLLPSPSYSNVPKFSTKVELNNKGLIMDGFHVNKNWSEQELRDKLQATFENELT
ncbi:Hypothetical predicted protein, partial [Paramuricea clavata]